MKKSIQKFTAGLVFGLMGLTLQAQSNNFSPYADLTINTRWDQQTQDMVPMDLVSVSQASGVKKYHLAFVTDSGSCNPSWGGQASYSVNTGWGSRLTDRMRASALSYVISFGGANGNDISMYCSETQLNATFEKVIQTYKPTGLDFDIENGSANVSKLLNVLKKTQKAHPTLTISFTLPVLPEGLIPSGQDLVRRVKTSGLRYSVNIMAMDYGPAYPGDMGQYATQAATSVYNFIKSLDPTKADADLWKMIEVTPMIGVNDVNVEQFTLSNVDTLRNFAKQHGVGLSMWSVARDNPCPDQWASPTCSGRRLQSKPYDFSRRFIQ